MPVITKPSKKTSAKYAWKTAVVLYRHPTLRRATVRAARPTAKLGWIVGKIVVKRKARQQLAVMSTRVDTVRSQGAEAVGAQVQAVGDGLGHVASAARTGGQLAIVYGPLAAEVFGLVEPPKRRRTAPVLVAGIVLGAAAVYFLGPNRPEHR